MNTILPEFMGSMARIRNNFYFSFLALNFVNLRPFTHDIILPVAMSQNIMTSGSLNSFDKDGIQEHGNSIRRHFLNDMVIAYERYSMLMIASHNNGQHRIDPALVNDRRLGAHLFEQLVNVYQPNEGDCSTSTGVHGLARPICKRFRAAIREWAAISRNRSRARRLTMCSQVRTR
jgi:hypothetical protein